MRNTRRPRSRGFTLMELLLVMFILMLLVGFVATRFMGRREKATSDAALMQVKLFKSSLEQYALDMNGYPNTEQGLQALTTAPGEDEETGKWAGPYLTGEVPKDPWDHDYQYAYPPEKNKDDFPDIWSLGPDGEDGTDDDIGNWPAEASEEAPSE